MLDINNYNNDIIQLNKQKNIKISIKWLFMSKIDFVTGDRKYQGRVIGFKILWFQDILIDINGIRTIQIRRVVLWKYNIIM